MSDWVSVGAVGAGQAPTALVPEEPATMADRLRWIVAQDYADEGTSARLPLEALAAALEAAAELLKRGAHDGDCDPPCWYCECECFLHGEALNRREGALRSALDYLDRLR